MLIHALLKRSRALAFAGALGLTGLLMGGCATEQPNGEDAQGAEAAAIEASPTPGH